MTNHYLITAREKLNKQKKHTHTHTHNAHKAFKKYFYSERKFSGIARCRPDRLWGLTSLLFHGFRGSFPGVKRPGFEADNSLPSTAEVKSGWGYTSTPPIRLHDMNRDFTFFNLTKTREIYSKLRYYEDMRIKKR